MNWTYKRIAEELRVAMVTIARNVDPARAEAARVYARNWKRKHKEYCARYDHDRVVNPGSKNIQPSPFYTMVDY